MKKQIMTIIAFVIATAAMAEGLEEGLRSGKEVFNKSKSFEETVEAVNYFDRLSGLYTGEWLPLYYAGYASLSAALRTDDSKIKDEWYLKGLEFIERAKPLKKDESEMLALEGYLKLMYISNKAMQRAPSQTGAAIALLEKSKQINPANPRPWFVHGQNTFFTPEFFGGGKANAKPLLEKAGELYKAFKPQNDLMPNWGKERCEALLKQAGN